jgi:hypothetical protein
VTARLGRRLTIRFGLVVVCATMMLSLFLKSFLPLAAIFAVGGMGWSLVNVNSLPMVAILFGRLSSS